MELGFLSNLSQVIGTIWQIAIVPILGWLVKRAWSVGRERARLRKELKEAVDKLTAQFNALQIEHNALHNQHDTLREEHDKLTRAHNKLQADYNYLQENHVLLIEKNRDLEKRVTEAERKSERDEATIKELRSEVLKLGLALDRRETELKEAQGALKESKRVTDELTHKVGNIEKKGTGDLK